MNFIQSARMAFAAVLCSVCALSFAQQPVTLKPGDEPPALKVRQWMQGAPIEKIQKGHVYVFEFWATWCGPCIAAMPHLSELAGKYAGKVTFTGVDVWEAQHYPNSDPVELVEAFMKKNPGRMTYNVAVDDDNYMGDNWLRAAGQGGIPSSFIIDRNGRIAWIGHPHYIETVLERVVAGTFDLAAFTAEENAKKAAREAEEAPKRAITQPVQDAFEAKDYDKVLTLAAAIEKEHPELSMYVIVPRFQSLVAARRDSEIQAIFQPAPDAKPLRLRDALAVYVVEADGLQADTYRAAAKFLDDLPRTPGTKVTNLLEYSARASLKAGDYDKAIESARQAVEVGVKDELLDSQIKTYRDLIEKAQAAKAAR